MIAQTVYGKTTGGQEVKQFAIRNANGLEVRCIEYGCRVTNILLPDKSNAVDVLLGFDKLEDYEKDTSGQGAFIGRYANRIKGASFSLSGKTWNLTKNEGANFLHGSLGHKVFHGEATGENSLSFTYTSPAGEDGFPGEVELAVSYILTDENELLMDYRAVSDADTYLNLTNHSYFNMAGYSSGSIENQVLWLNASTFLEVDKALCPTGRVLEVAGGAFDFTDEKPIGRDIGKNDPQLAIGGGYDHCFIIDKPQPSQLMPVGALKDPGSTRTMQVFSTQPAVQLYTSNFLDGTLRGKGGLPLLHRGGVCLETQHYPDSPANPDFPSTLLQAGDKFREVTICKFSW